MVLRFGVLLVGYNSIFGYERTGAIHGSEAYDVYAQNILTTGVYGREAGVPDAQIPPLYSYAVAVIYALLGRSGLAIGLFHTALDVTSIMLIVAITRKLFAKSHHAEWTAWFAGLFFAAYPYLIFQNLTLIDTPFFMTLFCSFTYVLILLREQPTYTRKTALIAILGGLILGITTLNRPILPFFAVFAALWFLFRLSFWQSIARLLPVALISVVCIVPWIVRNYAVYDEFVMISLTAGSNLYQGWNPDVIPFLEQGYDPQWTAPDPEQIQNDPYSPAGDRERSQLAIQYIQGNPQDALYLAWLKFQTHWSIDIFPRLNPTVGTEERENYQGDAIRETSETGEIELGGLPVGDPIDLYSTGFFDQLGRLLQRYYFGALFFLALVGIFLSRHLWQDVSLLWFTQISMTIVYVLFHPSTRYRAPSDPFLFIFSAFALVHLVQWVLHRRR